MIDGRRSVCDREGRDQNDEVPEAPEPIKAPDHARVAGPEVPQLRKASSAAVVGLLGDRPRTWDSNPGRDVDSGKGSHCLAGGIVCQPLAIPLPRA